MIANGDGEYVQVISAVDGATVTIENGTFTSTGCTAIYATRGATVTIYGGTFTAEEKYEGKYYTLDVNELTQDEWGKITVYGGTFVNFDPANHTNDGAYTNKLATNTCLKTEASTDNGNTTYTVVKNHHFDENNICTICGASQTETWEKLTSKTELKIGDYIVFVYESGKMELSSISTTNTKYGIGVAYNNLPNGVMIFEVVTGYSAGTIAFKNGNNYLYWSSGNSLSTDETLSANTSWTVTVDENGNATVKNAKDSTRVIKWNPTDPRFACYSTSGQAAISIYVKTSKVVCAKCVMETVDHKDASCGVAGYTLERCSVCGKEERTEHEALTHDYTGANPYICVNGCGVHNLPEAGSTITIQQALWIAETLENGKETSNKYVITGVIDDKDHPSSTGATIITADGKSIYITNIYNADGTVRHDAFTVKLQHGNKITVSAKIAKNSSGEAQLHETRLNTHTDTNPADHTCDICGATEITDHADENSDNICDICGNAIEGGSTEPTPDPETPIEKETTYTFSEYPAGTQYAKNEEHKLDDNITIVTTDSHFTSELRLYSSTTNNGYAIIKSTKSSVKITKISVNAGNKADTLTAHSARCAELKYFDLCGLNGDIGRLDDGSGGECLYNSKASFLFGEHRAKKSGNDLLVNTSHNRNVNELIVKATLDVLDRARYVRDSTREDHLKLTGASRASGNEGNACALKSGIGRLNAL